MRLLLVAVASAAALGASAASAQVVDLPDTSTVPVLPDLPDLPDLPVVPDVPDAADVPAVLGVTGTESQPGTTQSSGTSGASSGSSSRSGSASRARVRSGSNGTHTRFDRLPPRFERVLERILAGRHVGANLRRLERLLASASPRLHARILRLVRHEIRALEQGGTTPAERRRIKRLHRVEDLLASPTDATAATAGTPVSAVASSAGDAAAGDTSGSPSGVAAVSAAGISEPRKGAGSSASAGSRNGILGFPSRADGITFGTFALVLGALLLAYAAGAFALAALPTRAVPMGIRQQLSRSDLATLGLGALAATMLLLLVAAVL